MKIYKLSATVLTSLFLLFQLPASAQQQRFNNCFYSYKQKGDIYKNSKNYDLAIQQYQSAKYCSSLTIDQRKTLDSLIADVNKKRPVTTIRIIKRV